MNYSEWKSKPEQDQKIKTVKHLILVIFHSIFTEKKGLFMRKIASYITGFFLLTGFSSLSYGHCFDEKISYEQIDGKADFTSCSNDELDQAFRIVEEKIFNWSRLSTKSGIQQGAIEGTKANLKATVMLINQAKASR